jgi:hypothetical protein
LLCLIGRSWVCSHRVSLVPSTPRFSLLPHPLRAEALALVAVVVTQVVCIFYLRADAIVAPCLGQLGSFVPPGQANTCAQLKAFKQSSDVGITFLLCSISFGVIFVLVGCIVYLRVREAAIADPNSRAAKWMRTNCGRRLARYAKKLEASNEEERKAVASFEATKVAKVAAKDGNLLVRQVHRSRSSSALRVRGDEGRGTGIGGTNSSDASVTAAINNPMMQLSRSKRAGASVRFVLPPTPAALAATLRDARTSTKAAPGRGRATLGALGLPAPAQPQLGEGKATDNVAGRNERFTAEPLSTPEVAGRGEEDGALEDGREG